MQISPPSPLKQRKGKNDKVVKKKRLKKKKKLCLTEHTFYLKDEDENSIL